MIDVAQVWFALCKMLSFHLKGLNRYVCSRKLYILLYVSRYFDLHCKS